MENDVSLFSRRDFLKSAGVLGVTGVSLWAGGCEGCLKQIQNRPTRRNISHLSATDPIIQSYSAAVSAMKALSVSDPNNPLGWTKQAEIHNNFCPHGNWFFLPWHRAYLLYFERICRKMSGDKDFALPYWNWTTNPSVPTPFWGPASNPLYDSTRSVVPTDTADPSWIGAAAIDNILSQASFILFASDQPHPGFFHYADPTGGTGMLEGNPHNNIHGWVCGDMCAFMSPLDPVFWTHHNMLDCLWVDWNINLGNSNTNDSSWTNRQFTEFFDENGNPATVQVIDTILFPLLSYQFEPCAPHEKKSALHGEQLKQFLQAGAPSKFEISRRFELKQAVRAEVGRAATGRIQIEPGVFTSVLRGDTRAAAVLTISEVEVPVKRDFFVRVFINMPDASASTAIEDPHYAGSFGIFFDEAAMKNHPVASGANGRPQVGFLVNITPTLRKLNQAASLTGAVDVSLVPVPYGHREAADEFLTLGHLDLALASF
jgi:tyrosinase